jgi:hypothetical protein
LTNIFQDGSNHQPDGDLTRFNQPKPGILWETMRIAPTKGGLWIGFDEETLEFEEIFTNTKWEC